MKKKPSAKAWVKEGEKVLMTTVSRFPLVFEKGTGATLIDADGKSYLDFVGGVAVNALGHSDPKFVKALRKQAGRLIHVSNYYYTPPQIQLAKLLTERSFADRVFFCNSGAEANEAAIKLARKYAKEKRGDDCFEIIATYGSFHGRTLATVSATGQEKLQKGFEPLVPGFKHVPFDDPEAIEKAVTPQTAAVLVEPIQGEGGVRLPQKGYLAKLREICDRHHLLLMLDEIQTGMGRTGRLFAYEQEGIAPDILTLAKGLGAGFPIGALLATEEVARAFTPGSHSSTFGGNPLACSAGVAVMERLTKGFLKEVRDRGAYLLKQLSQLQRRFPAIKEVRGAGLIAAIDIDLAASEIVEEARVRGLLLNRTSDRTLRFVPPLTIRRSEIDKMIGLLSDLIAEKVKVPG